MPRTRLSASRTRSATMSTPNRRSCETCKRARLISAVPTPQPTSRMRLPGFGFSAPSRNSPNASFHQRSRTCLSVSDVRASRPRTMSAKPDCTMRALHHWTPESGCGIRDAILSWKLAAGTGDEQLEALTRKLYPSRVADTEKARRALTSESRITLSKDQASCDLASEMAIVNFENGVYYGLDPTGARIWKLLSTPLTIQELCSSLASVYDVDQSRLDADIRAFIGELADQGLVEIT